MNNRFLFELGTEEIPASMIEDAVKQMCEGFERVLNENRVAVGPIRKYATPRRLAVVLEGLPDRCPDREEVVSGPPAAVAFDSAGKATPAAQGFARKMGVAVEDLKLQETERGSYLVLNRQIPGEAVPEVLRSAIPDIVRSISWPKTMYWSESRFRFIRPLRWFVCLWNEDVVPFEIEGVNSGRVSWGHRLIGVPRVEISSPDSYVESLRGAGVLVDPAERRTRIDAGLKAEAGTEELLKDDALLDTVVQLNEFPSVLRGGFDPAFLEIPGEVLVTVMRYHQKYFSLLDSEDRLAPAFLTVLNTDGDPEGSIRRGHEKVLQARLEDAAFFWKSDQKTPLRDRLDSLQHVLFQEKLGSYFEKTERLRSICRELGGDAGLDDAAALCKVDLTTDMVRELTELQGIMGGLYARQEGLPEGVWRAIYDQYRPISLDDELPETLNGALLSIADRIDTVVGCFGVGIIPTGSSDPFALRRQAQGLITILLSRDMDLRLDELVDLALRNFKSFDRDSVRETVLEFLHRRLVFLLERDGLETDVIRSVFAVGVATATDARERALAVAAIKGDEDFSALSAAFKRAQNLLSKAGEAVGAVDETRFEEPGERLLFEAVSDLAPRVKGAVEQGDYLGALRGIARIRPAVDRFFEDVLVMAEEPFLRRNRLALLGAVADLVLVVADPSEIVHQGGENER